MKKDPVIYLKHNDFNFNKARKIALFYAHTKQNFSIQELSMEFYTTRSCISRYLRVSIIFSLISKDETDKIIDKRLTSYNKSYKTKKKSLETFEKCAELSLEREKILKKLDVLGACFCNTDTYKILYEKMYLDLLKLKDMLLNNFNIPQRILWYIFDIKFVKKY